VSVAGKTGTAQVSQGGAGYRSGQMWYWLSFCGYFPADNPLYSCIVCLKKPGLPASGGGMAGAVFHQISEGVMAKYLKRRIEDARDTMSVPTPMVKDGNVMAAGYVLKQLGIKAEGNWGSPDANGLPVWGKSITEKNAVMLTEQKQTQNIMPDVTGMGARDAIYLLEQRGLKVRISGTGRVKSQSIPFGRALQQGMTCELRLEQQHI
jgi:cell division protein FtsI (penicillin-binding protein 3)